MKMQGARPCFYGARLLPHRLPSRLLRCQESRRRTQLFPQSKYLHAPPSERRGGSVKTRCQGPTLTSLFGHSPGRRRAHPSGLCPGATVATVEHGVPLMRPKRVHRPWAHHEDGQGKESRPAGGPPNLPHGYPTSTASATTTEGLGDLPGSSPTRRTTRRNRIPNARQEARLAPGFSIRTAMRISLPA